MLFRKVSEDQCRITMKLWVYALGLFLTAQFLRFLLRPLNFFVEGPFLVCTGPGGGIFLYDLGLRSPAALRTFSRYTQCGRPHTYGGSLHDRIIAVLGNVLFEVSQMVIQHDVAVFLAGGEVREHRSSQRVLRAEVPVDAQWICSRG